MIPVPKLFAAGRKKRTPRIACPCGQPRERTPERSPQLLAIQAKSCLAGLPAGLTGQTHAREASDQGEPNVKTPLP